MKILIESILRFLEQGEDLVVATIINQKGSSPRGSGTKTVVRENGEFFGTIGGGPFEAEVLDEAAKIFKTKGIAIHEFDMTHEQLAEGKMICGGQADVLIEYVKAGPLNLKIFQAVQLGLTNREKCFLLTELDREYDEKNEVRRCLVAKDNSVTGTFGYPDDWLDKMRAASSDVRNSVLSTTEGKRFWIEPVFLPATLYLFGAGHVSKETSMLGMMVEFRTVVLDDREEFANPERFPPPAEVNLIAAFEGCMRDLDIGTDSYLVIVTRGHKFDKDVLSQALKTQAAYIGMIGSRRKRDTIYKALIEDGYSEKELARVHSPIGLEIGADSPQEIAVSIVAELVKIRSQKEK